MVCVAASTFGLSGPKRFGCGVVWSSDMSQNRVSDLCFVSDKRKRETVFRFWWITMTLSCFLSTHVQYGAQAD